MQTHQTKIEDLSDSKGSSQPLVSIIVITYNSSKYVIETLESAKAQTYQNIELIVSDDCSSDHTVDLCQKWIDENKERFVRTRLLRAEVNTGITANCNRGLYASEGVWVKFIAGDDILYNDCIETFINATKTNKKIYFFSSAITPFSDKYNYKPYVENEKYFRLSAKKQLETLLTKGNFIIGSSVFLNRDALKALGGYNESYKNIEDFPLFLNAYDNGYIFYYINQPTVKYRIHDLNTSLTLSNVFIETNKKIQKELLPKNLLKHGLYLYYWHNFLLLKREDLPVFLRKLIMLLSPIYVFNQLMALFKIERAVEINFRPQTTTR